MFVFRTIKRDFAGHSLSLLSFYVLVLAFFFFLGEFESNGFGNVMILTGIVLHFYRVTENKILWFLWMNATGKTEKLQTLLAGSPEI